MRIWEGQPATAWLAVLSVKPTGLFTPESSSSPPALGGLGRSLRLGGDGDTWNSPSKSRSPISPKDAKDQILVFFQDQLSGQEESGGAGEQSLGQGQGRLNFSPRNAASQRLIRVVLSPILKGYSGHWGLQMKRAEWGKGNTMFRSAWSTALWPQSAGKVLMGKRRRRPQKHRLQTASQKPCPAAHRLPSTF